jgi:nucleoid DNA-binding protein
MTRLTKNEIAKRVETITGVKPNLTKNVIDAIGEVLVEEVSAGRDFSLPGIVRISHGYTPPRRKGDVVAGFGGQERTVTKNEPEKLRVSIGFPGGKKKLMLRKGSKGYKSVVSRKS